MINNTVIRLLLVTFSILMLVKSLNASENGRVYKKQLIYYKKSFKNPETNPTFTTENRCKNLADLFNSSDDCKFDPDDYLDVPQLIRRHGYPSETHVVETEDGYLLKVHRIQGNKSGVKGGQPVFLQHGLMGSSADWVLNGDTSLAFYLADNGYDVWLGNARGNIYSKGHVSLPPHSPRYWNFTWHEMGTKDLPAVLYHISNTTGKAKEIIYIGTSMGTTMLLVMASTLPEVAELLKFTICLAPIAYLSEVRSHVKYLAPYAQGVYNVLANIGVREMYSLRKIARPLSFGCKRNFTKKMWEQTLYSLAGYHENEFDLAILPKILNHDPAGSSTKAIVHYGQEILANGNFQQFDYGPEGNKKKYGATTPPPYKLQNVKCPIYIYYAENDFFSGCTDVENLAKNLSNLVGLYKIPQKTFGHLDYNFGVNAYEIVYKHIVQILENYKMDTKKQRKPIKG